MIERVTEKLAVAEAEPLILVGACLCAIFGNAKPYHKFQIFS